MPGFCWPVGRRANEESSGLHSANECDDVNMTKIGGQIISFFAHFSKESFTRPTLAGVKESPRLQS